MSKIQLPYVKMPSEFTHLLKANLGTVQSPSQVFDVLRHNRGLYRVLEVSFKEFDDGRGVEKLVVGLGWPNFRERMASLYVSKAIFGEFPSKTSMDLVEDIKAFEASHRDYGLHGQSRLFLLGFYIRLANVQLQQKYDGKAQEIKVPESLHPLLRLSQGKSDKVDWLILILLHLAGSIGEAALAQSIAEGKKLNEIYYQMLQTDREQMHRNLLSYANSINEADFFLYEKV